MPKKSAEKKPVARVHKSGKPKKSTAAFALWCPVCRDYARLITDPVKVKDKEYKILKTVLLPSADDRQLVPTKVIDRYIRTVMEYTCYGKTVYTKSGQALKPKKHKIRRLGKSVHDERTKVAYYNARRLAEEKKRLAWINRHAGHITINEHGFPTVTY